MKGEKRRRGRWVEMVQMFVMSRVKQNEHTDRKLNESR
jgi:hypothetical protein